MYIYSVCFVFSLYFSLIINVHDKDIIHIKPN